MSDPGEAPGTSESLREPRDVTLDAPPRDAHERLRSLIENTSHIILLLDPEGVILFAGPSSERVLGFAPQELAGRAIFECLHPDDLPPARRVFEQVLRYPGAPLPCEHRMIHKGGGWRVLEMIIKNCIADPVIGGAVVTGHDITRWKQAEADLMASQGRYAELFENANDVIFTHDLTGTLTSINKAGEALTGYTRDEALGCNLVTLIAPEHRALAREMFDRKIGGEPRTTYEIDIINKEG